jgi:phosphate starvation-inducible membrane PsiE
MKLRYYIFLGITTMLRAIIVHALNSSHEKDSEGNAHE